MFLLPLQIGSLTASVPIVQGGMGVGVSLSNLASAVANAGGIGVISGTHIGFREPDFYQNPTKANIRALKKEIQKAKMQSPQGVIGINFLTAFNHYADLVKVAVEEKIDIIFSGAGLPVDLPAFVKGSATKIVPIISSAKAAVVITKLWQRRYDYLPDALVVEGPEAGGHLGFTFDQLRKKQENTNLSVILQEVKKAIHPFEIEGKKIPLIAAGGIFTGEDIQKYLKLGASGVQMGTRFIATEECDAPFSFKEQYINVSSNNLKLIQSPVGLPGRVLYTPFIKKMENEKVPVQRCLGCLKTCQPQETPYCISEALIQAARGNVMKGLFFAGSSVCRIKKMMTVKELIKELVDSLNQS
ncbi:MAG: nitronate monooxygenase [Epulopiscium sp.]|nr:nitronate monooxygenase [Candidatus Epulonipiscium sp.]